jgi:hypothetical protein
MNLLASLRCFLPALAGAVLLVAPQARAQSTLTGTVINQATGATLEGARVVLPGRGEALADAQGVYRF